MTSEGMKQGFKVKTVSTAQFVFVYSPMLRVPIGNKLFFEKLNVYFFLVLIVNLAASFGLRRNPSSHSRITSLEFSTLIYSHLIPLANFLAYQ